MKNIVNLKVTQVRLYPADALPVVVLNIEKNLTNLRETFGFKKAATGEREDGPNLLFLAGELPHDGKTYPIEQLQIEPRKITFSLFGPSAIADAFYEMLRRVLSAVDPERDPGTLVPYLKADETSCIATLTVDFKALFSQRFLRFLKWAEPHFSSQSMKSQVFPSKFSAQVVYEASDPFLQKVGIMLAGKLLTIEPRVGTSLDERRYYTHSPTDSQTHFAILQEFERTLSRGDEGEAP